MTLRRVVQILIIKYLFIVMMMYLAFAEYVQPSKSDNYPSCILVDVFHEMDKVGCTISRKHSLHHEFHTAFSDTMLILDKGNSVCIPNALIISVALKF